MLTRSFSQQKAHPGKTSYRVIDSKQYLVFKRKRGARFYGTNETRWKFTVRGRNTEKVIIFWRRCRNDTSVRPFPTRDNISTVFDRWFWYRGEYNVVRVTRHSERVRIIFRNSPSRVEGYGAQSSGNIMRKTKCPPYYAQETRDVLLGNLKENVVWTERNAL